VSRIIYLHGFASSPKSRKSQFFHDRFAEQGISMITPTLDGGDFENLTISGQLAILEDAIQNLGPSALPVTLMGSSMGGYLATLYAARNPGSVDRLILMAPAFGFATRWREQLGPAELEAWRNTGALSVFHYGLMAETNLSYRLMEDAVTYEDYPNATQPAIIFHGVEDEVVPVAFAEEFARQHPAADLHKLDSDHELIDSLDYICTHSLKFLKS
jgi:pimeloyl-ACP methyl ester carboxylesterase